jgi:NADPH:quinone reductase
MKAAFIEQIGPPENIRYKELPKPKPSGTQVLVKIEAVSVNPIDTYIRSGAVAMDLPMPFIVGCDLAGAVEAVGPDVKRFKQGDRVWGSNQGLKGRQGTFAEYAAVDECWLYATPDEVTSQDAASLALVGITAHLGLFRNADLKMGESVFVHGGSGGVGACVVQMARAVGARVITSAGSDEKVQICRQLGATAAFNYKTDNIDDALSRFGAIDVWFENLRKQDFELAIKHLAFRGRMIVMAGRDSSPPLPVGRFYTKDCALRGFAIFNSTADEQRKCAAEINRWLSKGRLRSQIDRVLPLREAAAAHQLQEDNTIRHAGTLAGKIVLVPGDAT